MRAYPAGVKVVVFRPNGDLLVLRRGKDHPNKALRTDIPGGLIEKGEPEITAAVRELYEESGIKVDPKDLEIFYTESFIHPISLKPYSVILYQVRMGEEPEVKLSYEHDSYEWCSIDDFLAKDDLENIQRNAINFGVSHHLFAI